jgi:hypothetical protein
MGEVVPRCGIRCLVKIIVRESLKIQRVKYMRVGTLCRCRVYESSLYSSAHFCEDALQLKHGRLRVSTRGSSSSMKGR